MEARDAMFHGLVLRMNSTKLLAVPSPAKLNQCISI